MAGTKGPALNPEIDAGWSSPVARQAHNLKVAGSNPAPATNDFNDLAVVLGHFFWKMPITPK